MEIEDSMGLLRIYIKKGINLPIRDAASSDPYVVITKGLQKLKTSVVKNDINPVWNEHLTLSIKDPNIPITLTIFDKDTFTGDDSMGNAVIDIKPYLEALRMGIDRLPEGYVIMKVKPNRDNCLAEESSITYHDEKITQNMTLRLKNVECGEVEIQLEWIDVPGCKGLRTPGIMS